MGREDTLTKEMRYVLPKTFTFFWKTPHPPQAVPLPPLGKAIICNFAVLRLLFRFKSVVFSVLL